MTIVCDNVKAHNNKKRVVMTMYGADSISEGYECTECGNIIGIFNTDITQIPETFTLNNEV